MNTAVDEVIVLRSFQADLVLAGKRHRFVPSVVTRVNTAFASRSVRRELNLIQSGLLVKFGKFRGFSWLLAFHECPDCSRFFLIDNVKNVTNNIAAPSHFELVLICQCLESSPIIPAIRNAPASVAVYNKYARMPCTFL